MCKVIINDMISLNSLNATTRIKELNRIWNFFSSIEKTYSAIKLIE